MRKERGAADCRDCAILVTEVKRRGELVSIIYCFCCVYVCTLLLYVWWHLFQYLLVFCLFVFHSCQVKRRGELVRTCIFCVVHSNLFCHLFHHFCFPLGEGHGSQDSEVRGKTDEDKWKVETKVVNIKMLMVL